MAEYYNVTTNLGDAEIANAIATNTKLNITHIAFGDGNGSVPTPTKTRTSLVREVHRQAVTKYERHATNANWIVIETIIPSDIGGFTIREMGIIANEKLISHGSHAPFEKVADPSGVSEYRLRFTQNVTDGSVVELTLDESLIYTTQAWIDENFVKRSEIIDNLTTNDATKPVSAKQAKVLQDNKLDKSDLEDASTTQKGIVQLANDLTTGGIDKALTAEQGKIINDKFNAVLGTTGYQKYLSGKIEQWGTVNFPPIASPINSNNTAAFTFPFAFPNGVLHIFVTNIVSVSDFEGSECTVSVESKTNSSAVLRACRVAGSNTSGTETLSTSVFAIGW